MELSSQSSKSETASAGIEVLFKHSPLDTLPDFIAYCQHLYTSGSMSSDLYGALRTLRRVLREHADELRLLKAHLAEVSPGTPSSRLSHAEDVELAGIEDSLKKVDCLEHKMKRNQYTLSKSTDNVSTARVLMEKLLETDGAMQAQLEELNAAKAASTAYQQLKAAKEALQMFYDKIGVTQLEHAVKKLQNSNGKASGSKGSQFENIGLRYVHGHFMAELSSKYHISMENMRYTANVTLKIPQVTGTAGELDGLVFEIDPDSQHIDADGRSCSTVRNVVAVIEMKRNIDDIGLAYESRLRTLRWLAGLESDAEAELRRNKHYPSGRFCEPLLPNYHQHIESLKQVYNFVPSSFLFFRELELQGRGRDVLHFFVRPSPLTCVCSSDSARIQFFLASSADIDEDVGLDSDINATALDALRLKIRKSSKQQAELDAGVIATSYQVALICKLHLLVDSSDEMID